MRKLSLAGTFVLVASTSLAQTDTAPKQPAPEEAPAVSIQQAAKGQPADLCQELLAFVKAPPPPPPAPAKKPADVPAEVPRPALSDTGTARENTAAAPARPAEQGDALSGTETAAGKNAAPASGKAVPPEAPEKSNSAQEVSGQTGPAHGAPEPNSQAAAQGNIQNAPQTSSLSAPVPTEPAKTDTESVLSLEQAEELATANDVAACRDAARKLRLAGAPMPPPLLALAALDLRYQRQADEASPADQTEGSIPATPEVQTRPLQTQPAQ